MVTQPDRPAGRGHKLTPTPVKAAAVALGLSVFEPTALRAFSAELTGLDADIVVVASYGRILPQAILDLPKSGIAFNVHPSLLPLYRGATPLQSAIRDGRSETGVTVMAMDAGMDTGDILLQERTSLQADETYGMLHDRLAQLGAELLIAALDTFSLGTLERVPQSSRGIVVGEIERTLTRPLGKDDMLIDWSLPPQRIVDTVRSLAPAPAARALLGGEILKVLEARVARADEHGTTADGGLVEAGVVLVRVVPPNRGAMPGAAYARAKASV